MKKRTFSFRIADVFAPAFPPMGQIYRRAKLAIITSEGNKMSHRQRPSLMNPAVVPLNFDCRIFRYYLRSRALCFRQISIIIVREKSSGFQRAYSGRLCKSHFLVKTRSLHVQQATTFTVNQPPLGSEIVGSAKLRKSRTRI